MTAHILIHGHDRMLLDTRGWVLEQAGFKVWRTSAWDELNHALNAQPFDLSILCHSLSVPEGRHALDVMHATRPAMRTLTFISNSDDFAEKSGDSVLSAFADPRSLIAKARELTGSQSVADHQPA